MRLTIANNSEARRNMKRRSIRTIIVSLIILVCSICCVIAPSIEAGKLTVGIGKTDSPKASITRTTNLASQVGGTVYMTGTSLDRTYLRIGGNWVKITDAAATGQRSDNGWYAYYFQDGTWGSRFGMFKDVDPASLGGTERTSEDSI